MKWIKFIAILKKNSKYNYFYRVDIMLDKTFKGIYGVRPDNRKVF